MTKQPENNIIDNFNPNDANYTFHREHNNGTLILKVRKAPVIVRSIYFLLSFICFLLPVTLIVINIASGGRFHFGFFISIFLFGLMGFFLLRNALWNTYGKELIIFNNSEVSYEADYGWFKDGKKEIKNENLTYSYRSVGYEEDQMGNLIIHNSDTKIESVVKLPTDILDVLINELKQ